MVIVSWPSLLVTMSECVLGGCVLWVVNGCEWKLKWSGCDFVGGSVGRRCCFLLGAGVRLAIGCGNCEGKLGKSSEKVGRDWCDLLGWLRGFWGKFLDLLQKN